MAKTHTMSLRIDLKIKAEVAVIYSRYGLTITDAIIADLLQDMKS